MIDPIFHFIAIPVLVLASWVDLKIREVPDLLSYGLIFAALGYRGLSSIINQDVSIILEGLFGFSIFLAFALAAFYTGQWGGGDAKLLMGFGAVFGFSLPFTINSDILAFIINLIAAGGAYGLLWSIYLTVKNRKAFMKETKKMSMNAKVVLFRRVVLGVALVFILLAFFVPSFHLKFLLITLAFLMLLSYLFGVYAKVLDKCCMEKMIPVEKLTEGDWIVDNVVINKKRICGPKDLGISKKQIETLLEYKKKGKIKKIKIKEGIPFVPSFLIAYLITAFWGNILLQIIPLR